MNNEDESSMTLTGYVPNATYDLAVLQERVRAVLAAYNALVAAQNTLDDRHAAWRQHVREQDARIKKWNPRNGAGTANGVLADKTGPAMQSQIATSVKQRDQARDAVIEAVAALAAKGTTK